MDWDDVERCMHAFAGKYAALEAEHARLREALAVDSDAREALVKAAQSQRERIAGMEAALASANARAAKVAHLESELECAHVRLTQLQSDHGQAAYDAEQRFAKHIAQQQEASQELTRSHLAVQKELNDEIQRLQQDAAEAAATAIQEQFDLKLKVQNLQQNASNSTSAGASVHKLEAFRRKIKEQNAEIRRLKRLTSKR